MTPLPTTIHSRGSRERLREKGLRTILGGGGVWTEVTAVTFVALLD